MNRLRSPQEAKYWLQAQGISIAYFARKHELDQATTYQVLSGTKKGCRGQAHKVAIALGIKEDIKSIIVDDQFQHDTLVQLVRDDPTLVAALIQAVTTNGNSDELATTLRRLSEKNKRPKSIF